LFANNFEDVFKLAKTGDKKYLRSADDHIATLFALSRPGTILITMSPMTSTLGIASRAHCNKMRGDYGLDPSDGASYYDEATFELEGAKNFTWNSGRDGVHKNSTPVYVYTRLNQSMDESAKGGILPATGAFAFRDIKAYNKFKYRFPFGHCLACISESKSLKRDVVVTNLLDDETQRYQNVYQKKNPDFPGVNGICTMINLDPKCSVCEKPFQKVTRSAALRRRPNRL